MGRLWDLLIIGKSRLSQIQHFSPHWKGKSCLKNLHLQEGEAYIRDKYSKPVAKEKYFLRGRD